MKETHPRMESLSILDILTCSLEALAASNSNMQSHFYYEELEIVVKRPVCLTSKIETKCGKCSLATSTYTYLLL